MLGGNTHNFHESDEFLEAWKPKAIMLRDCNAFDVTEVEGIEIHGLASMIGGSMALKLADGNGYEELKKFIRDETEKMIYDNSVNWVKKFLQQKFPNEENDLKIAYTGSNSPNW